MVMPGLKYGVTFVPKDESLTSFVVPRASRGPLIFHIGKIEDTFPFLKLILHHLG